MCPLLYTPSRLYTTNMKSLLWCVHVKNRWWIHSIFKSFVCDDIRHLATAVCTKQSLIWDMVSNERQVWNERQPSTWYCKMVAIFWRCRPTSATSIWNISSYLHKLWKAENRINVRYIWVLYYVKTFSWHLSQFCVAPKLYVKVSLKTTKSLPISLPVGQTSQNFAHWLILTCS